MLFRTINHLGGICLQTVIRWGEIFPQIGKECGKMSHHSVMEQVVGMFLQIEIEWGKKYSQIAIGMDLIGELSQLLMLNFKDKRN
jgi:hypothetical protein